METSKYLIVIAVHEGKNFDLDTFSEQSNGNYVAYLEARFNGEVLVSDPITLSDSSPQFNTELAWELDRKSLHLFRIERAPIKLQCFVEDKNTNQKTLIGYSVLDLRSAQERIEPRMEWKLLLNSKYKGPSNMRPELLCALQLLKCGDQSDSSTEQVREPNHARDDGPKSLEVSGIHAFDNDLRVMIADGYHKIWDSTRSSEADCTLKFNISVVIATASNLQMILPPQSRKNADQNAYYFRCTLFGNSLNTHAFTDLQGYTPAEKISFKVATTDLSVMNTYFQLNSTFEIQLLKAKQDLLGFVTISLSQFISENSPATIAGDFKLLPNDEHHVIEEPSPSLGIYIELEVPNASSSLAVPRSSPKTNGHSVPSPYRSPSTDQVKHFCVSVDVRSISLENTVSFQNPCYIRYSYPFFGYIEKVTTSLHELTNSREVIFKDGFFAFNFTSCERQMTEVFSKTLMLLEFIEKGKSTILKGHAKIDLMKLLQAETTTGAQKKVLSLKVPIHNPENEKLAELEVIIALQDFGSSNSLECSQTTANGTSGKQRDTGRRNDETFRQVESLLVDATVEIELWKEKKILQFQEELKAKESEYLGMLAAKNNTEHQNFAEKSETLRGSEERLRVLLKNVEQKEQDLAAKENNLAKKESEFNLRFSRLESEIAEAIADVKDMYDERFALEQRKVKALEEDKERLQNLLSEQNSTKAKNVPVTVPLKSPVNNRLRGALGRTNSVPNSVRVASKQNGSAHNSKPEILPKSAACNRAVISTKPRSAPNQSQPNTQNAKMSLTRSNVQSTSAERRLTVLQKLKKERDELLKSKMVREDDPMIKGIDRELRKHGATKL